ncbi:AraC family transcriptional regulator [Cupriavidus necator]
METSRATHPQGGMATAMPFSRWSALLRDRYGLECDLPAGNPFVSAVGIQSMDDVDVADVRMSPQVLTPMRSTPASAPALYVKLVESGGMTLERRGARQRFEKGSIAVVDPASPFTETIDDRTHLIVVSCPRTTLRQRGIRCQLDGWLAPDPHLPDTQVIQGMIRMAGAHGHAVRERTRASIANQLLGLMDILIGEDHRCARARAADATRLRVDKFLEQHLGDAGLSAEDIANGVKLSVNYLNRVFNAGNTSLMRYLWSQRLERARQMLSSPQFAHLSIGELAWRCGFSTAAHFSRLFQQRFGMTPSAQRRLACPGNRIPCTSR